jgi:hypothetical protein
MNQKAVISRRHFGKGVVGFTGLVLTGGTAGLSGCAKLGGDKAYKKAFYSAQVVYGIDLFGDLFEIFKNGGVIDDSGAKKAYEIADAGLTAFDEIAKLIKDGLPISGFDKARTIIAAAKSAVANGAIKFKSPKAQAIFGDVTTTIEITINLVEAINAGRKPDVARLEAEQKAKAASAQAAIAQADPTWYQSAIVRGSLLVSELSVLSQAEAPKIWDALKDRSAIVHQENGIRLGR